MINEESGNKNSEGRKEFTPTQPMITFFMDNAENYVKDSLQFGRIPDPESHFKYMCDALHKHEDSEVRVGFAQSLMFLGFREFLNITQKSIMQTTNMSKGLMEKLSKLSPEDIAKMSSEEASEIVSMLVP
jgi:hypothetical protein